MIAWEPIYVWNDGVRVATTNRAMNLIVHKELMREWMLKFSITNFDSVRPYIKKGAVIECAGQKYTVVRIKQNSGMTNTTSVECNHISYVGNHHYIPAGYSFVGTLHDLIQDMITQGHGTSDLQVGSCVDIGTVSFSLGNTDYQSLRSGIWALNSLGVELDYDNTAVNAYTRLGHDTGKTFEFGKDMLNLERSYDFSEVRTDNISYSIDVAELYKISPEYIDESFTLGDTILIKDNIIGDEIRDQRIVTYDECKSDPSQSKVTIGQFKRDDVTVLAEMQVQVDKSVQQAAKYSNVSIDHMNGFMATSADGMSRVRMNGPNGFQVQYNQNGTWATVWESNKGAEGGGKTIAYSLDHSQKIELGGNRGLTMWKSTDGGQTWIQTGGQDIDGNALANIISSIGSTAYGKIGEVILDNIKYQGLMLSDKDTENNSKVVMSTWDTGVTATYSSDNTKFSFFNLYNDYVDLYRAHSAAILSASPLETTLYFYDNNNTSSARVELSSEGVKFFDSNGSYGFTGEKYISGTTIRCKNGIVLED